MRRLLMLLSLISIPGHLLADHTLPRDATTLNRGTLPNARLDQSSVTTKGQLGDGTYWLYLSSLNVRGPVVSTSGFTGPVDGITISTVSSAVTQIINSSATTFVMLDGSTQTKTGSLTLGGRLNNMIPHPSSFTLQGNIVSIGTVAAGVNAIYNGTATVKGLNVDGTVNATLFSGKHSGDGSLLTGVVASAASSTSSYIQNLRITSGAANTTDEVRIWVDRINIMGEYYTNISTTLDISKGGPGGVDSGASAANEFLTIFLMSNGSTVTPVAVKSFAHEPVAPPSGYTKWRKVGYLYNNGSGNIEPFFQRDDRITYQSAITLFNGIPTADTGVHLDSQLYVSSDAITVYCYANTQDNQDQSKIGLAPGEYTGTMNSDTSFHLVAAGVASMQMSSGFIPVPLFESRRIKYFVTGSPTSLEVRVNGYRFGGLK